MSFPGLKGPADGKTEKSVPATHTVVTERCRKDRQSNRESKLPPCIQADHDHTKNMYDKHPVQPQQKGNDKLWQTEESGIV